MDSSKLSLRSMWRVIVALMFFLALGGAVEAKQLFTPLSEDEMLQLPAGTAALSGPAGLVERQRLVRLNLDQLASSTPGPDRTGSTLVFNLFPGLDVAVEALPRQPRAAGGSRLWLGRIAGQPKSSVTIASTEGIASGKLRTQEGHLFEIRYVGSEIYAIRQIDMERYPREHEPVAVPAGSLPARPDAPTTGDDGSVVDVLVIYTAKAMTAVGGEAAMRSEIALAESETNQGYANSGVVQRVRIVHSAMTNYNESGGFSQALTELTSTTDGIMDEVHALRDNFKADMVSLWIDNTQYCGIAWLMKNTGSDFASRAFSVVSIDCTTGYYSFAHEMGHNQGSHHDRSSAGGEGYYPYSFGYQHPSGPSFRTIMAYNCQGGCPRVNYWSNPEASFQSTPTGVASNKPNSADNALSLNNTRVIAANWRVSNGTPPSLGSLDLVWRNTNMGRSLVWIMQGTAQSSHSRLPDVRAPWRIVSTADFDGDGKAELLWINPDNNKLAIIYLEGLAQKALKMLSQIRVPLPWTVVGAADFDKDGNVDLLWRNPNNGRNVIMLLENDAKKSYVELPVLASPWRMETVADINNDGNPDLIWRNTANGRTMFMLLDGTTHMENVEFAKTVNMPWSIRAAGDFDGDGKTDLVWRHPQNGRNLIMLMDGTAMRSNVELPKVAGTSGWGIAGAGRFD